MAVIGIILAVIVVIVIPIAIVVGIPYAAASIFYDNLIVAVISWILALSLGFGWVFGCEIMVSKYNWNDGSCRTCNEQLHLVGGARHGYVYSCDNDHPITIYANPNNF